jgi:D-beta-D-heptose 7-phosphate kinase/D-beta-D-heptose 1-phosphate adenosyltransferase
MSMRTLLEKIAKVRILVIGDLMLDHYIWGDATRISPEAPVPVVKVERDSFTAGGAANVALNLGALGVQVDLVGTTGTDDNGRRLAEVLQGRGLKLDTTLASEACPTVVKTRVMCRNQQLCRLDREAAPEIYALPGEWVRNNLPERIAAADAVILSDYAKGVITSELIRQVQAFAGPDKLVALDPKPRPGLNFNGLGLVTPNRNEAMLLAQMVGAGTDEVFPPEEVCRRLHERHATRLLVITLGADGMLISREGRIEQHVPTAARAVFDVSGAGDTVTAVLTAALAAGATPEAAVELANVAAGVVVAKLGTATATPEEVLVHAQQS